MDANMTALSQRFVSEYWSYYQHIENDVASTFKYVELDEINFDTYSRHYKDLLSAIGSEVDVVGKSIAELVDTTDKKLSKAPISHWGFVVEKACPRISAATVRTQSGICFSPWKNWKNEVAQDKNQRTLYRLVKGAENPEWWRAYNKTKHRRKSLTNPDDSSYEKANLGNVLNALAGLLILEIVLKDVIGQDRFTKELRSEIFPSIDIDMGKST